MSKHVTKEFYQSKAIIVVNYQGLKGNEYAKIVNEVTAELKRIHLSGEKNTLIWFISEKKNILGFDI